MHINGNKLLILLILLLVAMGKATAQSRVKLSDSQIDSTLTSKSAKNGKIDTLFSFEQFFKTYKKILGIKIRISKGIIYQETVLFNKQLLSHSENWIVGHDSRKHAYHDYYEIYFLNNKPVKYVRVMLWPPHKNGEEGLLRRKIILYLDQGNIVKTKTDIRDGYTMNEKKLNRILSYTNNKQHILLAEVNRILNYTNNKQQTLPGDTSIAIN